MQDKWLPDEDGYDGPERRSGRDRRKAKKRGMSGGSSGNDPTKPVEARRPRRPAVDPTADRDAQLLAALLALVDGETLDAAQEHELLMEGLVTRGSLAEGFQLTLRGTQMVRDCTPGDYWPEPGPDPSRP